MTKPERLRPGDRVAAISLSWGGPATFPHRYQAGKAQLEAAFGVEVVETRHALRPPEWLHRNPRARADDLMEAFADPTIKGIVSTIGGEDSIRLLPYLDPGVIRDNPTVFMGYSDTTITHAACFHAGLVSFYGPAIMAGFGENGGLLPYMRESVERTLFQPGAVGPLAENTAGWTVEFKDWAEPAHQPVPRRLQPCTGWRFLQETGSVQGVTFGGCLEVLDWLRGTHVWPASMEGMVLFLETSEEGPPPATLRRFLRCLHALGDLQGLRGILLARPGGQVEPDTFTRYDDALVETVRGEFGLDHIALVTHMDFGHTDPMMVLPQGVRVTVDSDASVVRLDEAAVT